MGETNEQSIMNEKLLLFTLLTNISFVCQLLKNLLEFLENRSIKTKRNETRSLTLARIISLYFKLKRLLQLFPFVPSYSTKLNFTK